MHIILIHQAFVSPEDAGGTRHFELASFCIKQGHDFTIVASDLSYMSGELAAREKLIISEQNIQGINVLRAYTYPSLHRSFVWRVFSFLSFMLTSLWAALKADRPNLVMGTSPPIFQAISAWLVARIKRSPFLLEVRDLWPEFAIDMGVLTNPVLITLSRWLEGFLYARAIHILVNSPAYRDYLIKKGIESDKISFISNGVDTNFFNDDTKGKSIRQEMGLNGKFVVTYAGALGLANDIPTILRAAERLKENVKICFLLVGDGKERRNLESAAQKMNLQNVIFSGSRPKAEMPGILAASDACIATLQNIPMFSTTYPNKVFDYMAAGKPTILAIDGVIRDVIETSNGGIFVPPGDDEAFAKVVQTLEKDRTKANEMGKSARRYVVENFDRKDQAKQFIELIEKLIQ